jgi:L-methionine (R)-S-oxide reductase
MNQTHRSYARLADAMRAIDASADRTQRMTIFADALWDALAPTGMSWGGFYIDHPDEPEDQRLILGPCRNGPACSPIGLHGACGQSLTGRRTLIVRDVADLGEGYIACDPRDKSEIVIPLFDEAGTCWGVLDLDSHDVGSFDESDEAGLTEALKAAGLTCAPEEH